MLDIQKFRNETPGCLEVLHFDNAGASLQPDCVYEAVVEYLSCERRIGGYAAARRYSDQLDSFYDSFSKLLNCAPEEVAFIENATRAWDMAFYSMNFERGDRILTAKAEYVSNSLAYLQVARNKGVIVDVVPNDHTGQLDIESLEDMIDEKVKLISITHIPTQGGLVNPAAKIGKIAQRYNIPYLLDACQSVGQMQIDVKEIGCDMLSGTGRKFLRGPRGTGFLYVKSSMIKKLEPTFIDLRSACWTASDQYRIREDAKRFENWECFFAGKVGLAKAAEYAMSIGLDNIYERTKNLAQILRTEIQEIPGVTVHDLGVEKCGIVTFTHNQIPSDVLQKLLAEKQINVSTSTVSSARWDLEERKLNSLTRASLHYFNTEEEVKIFCKAVVSLMEG
ncbi:MAG: aminotransferase class V-fold PLP-dependent enzyme [Gammaproteobacteria bacterium]|nr:aminotransferase class V-fold PLP-dependent enzyme [Gammaproteobacteria bacterium]